ncbi:MAG TPA: ribokinase [Cyclobacteriaceae bacterium]|nr:ribokinase [Cyclobacteriaceae bacterium]
MSKILVIGSTNIDLITKVERFPVAGETITGKLFMQAMGGKGANQALAAHRLGGEVRFVTCLGADPNGANALDYYTSEGLDISKALRVDHDPTGTAVILVNDEGENIIVITPGANDKLSPKYISKLESEIAGSSMVMLQMEIPMETVVKTCELAKANNVPVLLNVAPARAIDDDLIRKIEILVVNETEIEAICGKQIANDGEDALIDTLLSKGTKTVILTLGKKGCIIKTKAFRHHIPAFDVNPVDTTAAGDTFCGALVARLSNGESIVDAVRFATAAAAICVTRIGAQPSIPKEDEVQTFLLTNSTKQNGIGEASRSVIK